VVLGTSSGALTAGLFAQFADEPDDGAGEMVVQSWTEFGEVFTNPLDTPVPAATVLARLLGGGLVGRFVHPTHALLDTAPLRRHAGQLFAPDRVAKNIADGLVRSLAVATTVCPPAGSAARSRLFVQGGWAATEPAKPERGRRPGPAWR
jgi:hypothetical protein